MTLLETTLFLRAWHFVVDVERMHYNSDLHSQHSFEAL